MKPNLILISIWITALRSGEYNQTRRKLKKIIKSENNTWVGHCCLGVACELTLGSQDYSEEPSLCNTVGIWKHQESMPPKIVSEKFGINFHAELFSVSFDKNDYSKVTITDYLYGLNDAGYSFEQIADAIERKFLPNMRHS